MTTFVEDNFNGTIGTLLTAHTPDIDVVGGGWSVIANIPAGFTLSGSGTCSVASLSASRVVIDTGQSDFTITGKLILGANSSPSLFFRLQDNNNFYSARFESSSGRWAIIKRKAGGDNQLDLSPPGPTGAQTLDFEIVVQGAQITVRDLTNSVTVQATDTDFITETEVGFGDNQADPWQIDYTVSSPPPLPPVVEGPTNIEIVSFAAPASVGIQDITQPNLLADNVTPKGVVFHMINNSYGAPAEGLVFGLGAASAVADQWAYAVSARKTLPGTAHAFDNTKCIVLLDGAGSSNTVGLAAFVSFIPGGVRINWSLGVVPFNPGLRTIIAVFFAGEDVDCKAFTHPSTPNPLDITTIGFQPDGVIAAASAEPNVPINAPLMIGGYGWQDFQSPPEHEASFFHNAGNASPTDVRTQRSAAQTAGAVNTFGAFTQSVRYTDPDAQGMTARFDNGVSSNIVGAFAFRMGGAIVKVGNINAPEAAGDWKVTDPGFKPIFVGLMLTGTVIDLEADVFFNANAQWGTGFFTEDDEFSQSAFFEDNSTAPIADSDPKGDRAVFLLDTKRSLTQFEAAFKSMDPDGWTLNVSAFELPGGGVPKWGYLAVGFEAEVPAVPSPDEEDVVCVSDVWVGDPSPDLVLRTVDQVLAGAAFHFDISQLEGFVDGQLVNTLPDLTGNGCDATETGGAARHAYREAANGINGLPALEAQASSVGTGLMTLPTACADIGLPDLGLTIMVVRRRTPGLTNVLDPFSPLVSKYTESNNRHWALEVDSFEVQSDTSQPSTDPAKVAAGFDSVDPRLDVGIWFPGEFTRVYRNASLISSAAQPAIFSPTDPAVPIILLGDGDGDLFVGFMGEIIVWAEPLVAQEFNAVRDFLLTKWGLDNEPTGSLFYHDYESIVSGTLLDVTTPEYDPVGGGWVQTNRNGQIQTTAGRNHVACFGGFIAAQGGVIGADVGQANLIVKGRVLTFGTSSAHPQGYFVRDAGNVTLDGIEVSLDNGLQVIAVYEWVAGVRTLIASAPFAHFTSSIHQIRAAFRATAIDVFVDGLLYISTTSSVNPTETKVGLFNWECGTGTRSEEIEVYK